MNAACTMFRSPSGPAEPKVADENALRRHICEIGRRMYEKNFVAANDGNISCRLDSDRYLCTPTNVSKGFMTPEMIAVVHGDGRQLAGDLPRTSEVLMHLEIYRAMPAVQAVVHAHPPHATAFAVTDADLPRGILPEVEVLLGEVKRTEYRTPGTRTFASNIVPQLKGNVNTILLSNHGVVSFDGSIEQAYFHIETLEMYCHILLISGQIGKLRPLSDEQMRELLESTGRASPTTDSGGR